MGNGGGDAFGAAGGTIVVVPSLTLSIEDPVSYSDYYLDSQLIVKQLTSLGLQKIAVFFQNDAYGKNYLSGLKTGLGSHANQIVDAESYNLGDSAQVSVEHMVEGAGRVFVALAGDGVDDLSQC